MPRAANMSAADFDPWASPKHRDYCAEERGFVFDLAQQARSAAANPAAAPAALIEAARSLDVCGRAYSRMPPALRAAWRDACRAVTAHPGAPPAALLPLATRHFADCADGLLANPALPLLLLESPDLLAEVRRNVPQLRARRGKTATAAGLLAMLGASA